jgi:hypothetical protein
MKLKDKIKSKVDQLGKEDLEIIEKLLDSLEKQKAAEKEASKDRPPFMDVIELLGPKGLTTKDILEGRSEG